MSVLWVREHWPQRGGGFGHPLDSMSTRHFIVRTTLSGDSQFSIGLSGLLPSYLSAHPEDVSHRMRKLSFRMRPESPFTWDVTAQYSSQPLREEEVDTASPLSRTAKIRTRTVRREKAIYKDRDGNPIVNSANEPIEDATVGMSDWTLDVEKNVWPLPSWVFAMSDGKPRLNADPLYIARYNLTCDSETVMLDEMEIEDIQMEAGVFFLPIRFTLAYRAEGWRFEPANAGYNELGTDSTGNPALCPFELKRKSGGATVLSGNKHFLDNAGHFLTVPVNPDAVIYLSFDVLPTMDMSVLPLE